MSDEYTEHLEKLVDDLEQKAQLVAKVKQQAFLFRRVEKLLHQFEVNERTSLREIDEGLFDCDPWAGKVCESRLKIIERIQRDIEYSKEDMLEYDEDELLDPNFFNF
jgi:hypothetical protein